ncbi:MAG: transglycosylase SLT domain-containing protein [Chitinophagales bacterium]
MNLIKFDRKRLYQALAKQYLKVIVVFILLSNFATYTFSNWTIQKHRNNEPQRLYLLETAEPFVYDVGDFEQKVRSICHKLRVPPEWLMAVMHSESRFDASVANFKGSGATGLIQFMPTTAEDFDITTAKLRNLNHVQQLDYVYAYFDAKRKQYKQYETLTDLYLAVLYPKALGEDYCYTLYAEPSKPYEMNKGLDVNKDGRVTVQDIDLFLKQKYTTAYSINKPSFWGNLVTSVW